MDDNGSKVIQIPELRRHILQWLPTYELEYWKRENLFPECVATELIRREKSFNLSNDSQMATYMEQPGPYHNHLHFRGQPHDATPTMVSFFKIVGPTTKTIDMDIGILNYQPSNAWLYKAIGAYFPNLTSLKLTMYPLMYRNNFWDSDESIVRPIPSISNLEVSFWNMFPPIEPHSPHMLTQIARSMLGICPNVTRIQLHRCVEPIIQQLVTSSTFPRLSNLIALALEVNGQEGGGDNPTIASIFTNLEFVSYPLTKLHLTMFKGAGVFSTFERILTRFSATIEDIQLLGIQMVDKDMEVKECLWPAMPNLVRLGFGDDVTSQYCRIETPNSNVPWCKFVFPQGSATFRKLRTLRLMSKYHHQVVRISSSIKLLKLLSPLMGALTTVKIVELQLPDAMEPEPKCHPKCSTCSCWSNQRIAIKVRKLFPNAGVSNAAESYMLRDNFPMYGYGYNRVW